MRTLKHRLKRQAAEWLALPPDTLLDVPRVTCTNGTDVIVENVRKLVRVAEDEVELNLDDAVLHVQGSAFEVTLVTDREVHIHGMVNSIVYNRAEGRPGP